MGWEVAVGNTVLPVTRGELNGFQLVNMQIGSTRRDASNAPTLGLQFEKTRILGPPFCTHCFHYVLISSDSAEFTLGVGLVFYTPLLRSTTTALLSSMAALHTAVWSTPAWESLMVQFKS